MGLVQRDSDLAEGIELLNPDRAALVSQEYAEVVHTQATDRRRPRQVETRTLLVDQEAAEDEAERQAELSIALPDVFEAVVDRGMFDIEPGQSVRLTHRDLGFASGRECLVIGVRPDIASQEVALTLWG